MVTRTMGGATRDYLLLEYRGGDQLYLPTDQIELLTPYAGGDSPDRQPAGRLGVAAGPVQGPGRGARDRRGAGGPLPAAAPGDRATPSAPTPRGRPSSSRRSRSSRPPTSCGPSRRSRRTWSGPSPWTGWSAATSGFGKTEVAIRAVFKAVQDGFQAAVLVPTTLLASQHAQTFADRYAPFPVKVEMLSRFLTNAQAKAVLAGLADGSVDVVVGTHRLLGRDVTFKKLGLLVVDEEQRFGVSHKESIKALADGIDVLTLTASPIPRTLEMALTGIRDLSMVNTPPAARRPILTHVGEFEEAAASRGHPARAAARGPGLLRPQPGPGHRGDGRAGPPDGPRGPGGRGPRADGRGHRSRQVVLDFWEGGYDVLVCTTIIESGIDMPTVNTLVVDRADLLGLGQLHQLRGRVGRAGQRAYAYLFHPVDRVLSETGLRAAAHHRRPHRARLGVQDRPARPADPGGGQPARARPVRPHRRHRLRPLRPDGRPRRSPS